MSEIKILEPSEIEALKSRCALIYEVREAYGLPYRYGTHYVAGEEDYRKIHKDAMFVNNMIKGLKNLMVVN